MSKAHVQCNVGEAVTTVDNKWLGYRNRLTLSAFSTCSVYIRCLDASNKQSFKFCNHIPLQFGKLKAGARYTGGWLEQIKVNLDLTKLLEV